MRDVSSVHWNMVIWYGCDLTASAPQRTDKRPENEMTEANAMSDRQKKAQKKERRALAPGRSK